MRVALAVVMGVMLTAVAIWRGPEPATALAQSRAPAGTLHDGNAFRFNKVAEGVYHAVGTGALQVVGNSAVIVNDDDVMIVDDHVSPAAAWVLLEEVKTLTSKPVRYVVNTHFHFDHAHGNQVFGPNVEIIGHEFTRQMLLGKSAAMPLFQNYLSGLPATVDGLRKRVDAETAPEAKAKLRVQLQAAEQNAASQKEFRSVPPNVTLRNEMTIYRGNREIQLRHLGRGHTAGDVVVLLPGERVVITGDFLTAGLSNLSDSYPEEWVASLDALKKLPFDTVLPGHGEAFTDKAKIDHFQAWLRDVWTGVGALKKQGVSFEEAAKRVDLTRHKGNIPAIQGPGIPVIGAQRIYELMDAPPR
jgi:glyoxylase-like metal-dependent hydrolase (beta-lactamase superfamily II)